MYPYHQLKRNAPAQPNLPPLPESYYNGQIDEVSSARTSIIEKESEVREREKNKKKGENVSIQDG